MRNKYDGNKLKQTNCENKRKTRLKKTSRRHNSKTETRNRRIE